MAQELLREFISGVIKEAAMSVASAASEGLALWVNKDASGIDITLYDPAALEANLAGGMARADAATAAVVGTVSLAKHRHKCNGAWEVNSAAAEPGIGPLMYDIARSIVPSGFIMSDRDTVSDEAQGIWSFYLRNRSDVEKVHLDNVYDPKTPPVEDDCIVYKPDTVKGKDMNPLNYAIGGKGPTVTKLRANHKAALLKLGPALGGAGRYEQMMTSASNHYFSGRIKGVFPPDDD